MSTVALLSVIAFLLSAGLCGLLWYWLCERWPGKGKDLQADAMFEIFTTPVIAGLGGILGVLSYLHWR